MLGQLQKSNSQKIIFLSFSSPPSSTSCGDYALLKRGLQAINIEINSADERSRTSTLFRALPPQGSVYTISPHPRKSHFIIPEAELKVFTLKI